MVAALATAALASRVSAHEAPTGWTYPLSCCSGDDCYQISSDEVRANRDGSYTILIRNETFYPPSSLLEPKFKWSEDQFFHRCSHNHGDRNASSICLFVPQPGV